MRSTLRRLPEPAPTFDLQSHSIHSDGALKPRQVVAAAAEAGVELLSLTDHDSVDGVEEAAAAASRAGIRLVTGVEVSALDQGQSDLHILGYGIDPADGRLLERLEYYRQDRQRRATAMTEALRGLGFELDESVLESRAAQGKSIGRPHLALAVVSHPANAERLAGEQREDPSAFLEAYLIEGRPAFRNRQAPTVPEAIEAIHDAGGVAVWAHPFWDISAPDEVLATIERFRGAGIDGVECFYATHTREQALLLADRCAELGMLATGSSDFHGPRHREFSRFRAFSTYGREPMLGPIGQPG
jgi:3',5'-nucleoside bisphosphate phosphatase